MAEAGSQTPENSMLNYVLTVGKALFKSRRPELVALSGVPKSTINQIMGGERKSPRYSTVEALHRAVLAEEAKQAKAKKDEAKAVKSTRKPKP